MAVKSTDGQVYVCFSLGRWDVAQGRMSDIVPRMLLGFVVAFVAIFRGRRHPFFALCTPSLCSHSVAFETNIPGYHSCPHDSAQAVVPNLYVHI